MRREREARIRDVVDKRQFDLTVVLENVHDQHNIGAVLRSCDSIGIREIYVLYSEPGLQQTNYLTLGKRTSAGARKWVDVHFYTDTEACFKDIRAKYEKVLSTHLDEQAVSLHELNLTQSVALLFGNERDGVSEEALAHSDGNFLIPQIGMVQSLNISVACAVTLYEAFRQRLEAGRYAEQETRFQTERKTLLAEYFRRHEQKDNREFSDRINE